ncbi:MAG: hypothetical protein HFI51_01930 [Lachnospiraceae bacterium]|nr:hypothetical protein [Lachnospiraceae bacterium]
MAYANYEPIIGTILNMTRGNDCCSQTMSLRTENGIVNFMIGPETHVIDNRPLRAGLRVAAFYDASLPVPLIFPPQYQAQIVAVLMRDEQIMLNEFDRNLTARDGSLQLNLARNTNIETLNGQNVSCNPAGRTLLVYYTATTRSIPPQTTPRRVVVFC